MSHENVYFNERQLQQLELPRRRVFERANDAVSRILAKHNLSGPAEFETESVYLAFGPGFLRVIERDIEFERLMNQNNELLYAGMPIKEVIGPNRIARRVDFHLSPHGSVQAVRVQDSISRFGRMLSSRPLHTTTHFRGGRLSSYKKEAPNGSLFVDPKNSLHTIWPKWLKPNPRERREATSDDWELYMMCVQAGIPVKFEPGTRRKVLTERQAKRNLRLWRKIIYYKNTQVLHIRANNTGFQSEMGYRAKGRYGYFISNNPLSYRQLSVDETFQRLEEWSLPGYVFQ